MAPRSRGGCANCKKRKRKCDETKPQCLACKDRGIVCRGYDIQLKWGNGIASRGHLTRAEVPVLASTSAHRGSTSSVATEADAADLGMVEPAISAEPESADNPTTIPDLYTSSKLGDTDSLTILQEQGLLQRFLDEGLHNLYSTEIRDWIRPGIIVMTKESVSLVAMCITLQTYGEEKASERFYRYFEQALQIFKQELANTCGEVKRGSICAGILLCSLSIMTAIPWTHHITLMVNLYQLLKKQEDLMVSGDPLTIHCLEVIGVMDMPIFVAGRQTISLGLWKHLRRTQLEHSDGTDSVEIVTGFPRSMIDILARIEEPAAETELWLWCGCVGPTLLHVQLWDATRFAGMLYSRRLRRLHGTTESVSSESLTNIQLPSTEELVWRVLGALDALAHGQQRAENQNVLAINGALLAFTICSLEISIFKAHPEWQATLDRIGQVVTAKDVAQSSIVLKELLLEIRTSGDNDCDLQKATLEKRVEIALF